MVTTQNNVVHLAVARTFAPQNNHTLLHPPIVHENGERVYMPSGLTACELLERLDSAGILPKQEISRVQLDLEKKGESVFELNSPIADLFSISS